MSRRLLTSIVVLSGLGLAACYEPPPPPPPPPPPGVVHVRWCLANHPGYDPRTNLFPDRFGYPRVCRGPW